MSGAFGTPWMYNLRDTLQFATDLESGVDFLWNAKRTWAIWIGLSSKTDNELEILNYVQD